MRNIRKPQNFEANANMQLIPGSGHKRVPGAEIMIIIIAMDGMTPGPLILCVHTY